MIKEVLSTEVLMNKDSKYVEKRRENTKKRHG